MVVVVSGGGEHRAASFFFFYSWDLDPSPTLPRSFQDLPSFSPLPLHTLLHFLSGPPPSCNHPAACRRLVLSLSWRCLLIYTASPSMVLDYTRKTKNRNNLKRALNYHPPSLSLPERLGHPWPTKPTRLDDSLRPIGLSIAQQPPVRSVCSLC